MSDETGLLVVVAVDLIGLQIVLPRLCNATSGYSAFLTPDCTRADGGRFLSYQCCLTVVKPWAPPTFRSKALHTGQKLDLITAPAAFKPSIRAMADRPPPPPGSECLDIYEEGMKVYYYRSGIQPPGTMMVELWLNRAIAGKWRLAQVRSTESSGKRYVVS